MAFICCHLCGTPKKVTCLMNELYGTGSDEISTTVIEFENGAIGTVHTSFVSYRLDTLLEIIGTEGIQVISGTNNTNFRVLMQSKHIKGYENLAPVPAEDFAMDDKIPSAEFVKWVADKDRQSLSYYDVDAAILLTRLIECAYTSAKDQKTILY